MRESGVMYELDKFIYLGAPETAGHQIIYTRKELGLNSLEKLRAKPGLRIGAQIGGTRLVYRRTILRLLSRFQRPEVYRRLYRAGSRRRALARRARCAGECGRVGFAAQLRLAGQGRDGLSRHHGSAQGRQASSPWPPSRDRELCRGPREKRSSSRSGASSDPSARLTCCRRQRPRNVSRFSRTPCARLSKTPS